MSWVTVLTVVVALWVTVLSVVFFGLVFRFRGFLKDINVKTFLEALENVLTKEKKNRADIINLGKDIEKIKKEDLAHVQKLGLVRFNPFSETGGDHSFSLSLLDGTDSGVVLTGLHTRERTRIYIKSVNKAKSEHELSKEERKAIESASKKLNV